MNSKKKKIIISILIFLIAAVAAKAITEFTSPAVSVPNLQVISGDSVTDGTILPKTVMIYLDGADLEEKHGSSTFSVKEILNSGVNTDFHNILIYTGGCNKWATFDIPGDKDCIYLVRGGKLNLLAEYPAQNMGNQKTLEAFMKYCVSNYPSKQYGLILSDHGAGPNHGVCSDYRNNYDTLSMKELQNAFSAAGFGPQAKMEFIVFEACLMASTETAYCMKDYANYMAGSENVSYTYGSDFSFMSSLDKSNSGAYIGTEFVNCFYNKSSRLAQSISASGLSVYDITYSCIDLSEMDRIEQAMDALFAEANNNLWLRSCLSSASLNARGVKEAADSYGEATDTTYDLIDLVDWLQSSIVYEGNSLMHNLVSAVNDAVVHNLASTPHMNGLTIYYPHNIKYDYFYNTFGFSDEYSKHVKLCYDNAENETNSTQWQTLSSPVKEVAVYDNNYALTVKLSESQAENYAKAQYYILARYDLDSYSFEDDEYVLVSSGNQFSLSSDNILKAEFDSRVPVIYNSSDNSRLPFFSPLFCKKTESGETVYSTYSGLIYVPDTSDYPYSDGDSDSVEALEWVAENMRLDSAWLTLTAEGNSLSFDYAEISAEGGLPSRTIVDPYSYGEIEFYSPVRRVKYDSNNKLLPVSQWDITDSELAVSYNVNDVTIKLETISENVDYYAVMVVTDIYGNDYTSDIIALK